MQVKITVEIELEVEIDSFEPGEPMVRYYSDGSGYPGSAPEVNYSNAKMYLGGKEIIDAEHLSQECYDEILDAYLKQTEE